jgi:hypothetical protein
MGFREFLFGRQLKTLFRLGCNIIVLHAPSEAWSHLMETEAENSCIDVWWSDDATGNLMLLFAYLITRSDAWQGATLRVLAFRNNASKASQEKRMREILTEARIDADIVLAASKDIASVVEQSDQSTIVFLPFRFRGNLIQLPTDGPTEDLLKKLPPAVMVLAAEDIDLGAEPEEGVAAELAEARDLAEEKARLAKKVEKEAAEAGKAADTAEERLKKAMAETEADNAQIATLRADRDKAVEAAEELRRRAVRARTKAEQVQEALEKDETGPEKSGDKGV